MSTLYKDKEVKKEPIKATFQWSAKDNLKTAIFACKAFLNGGSTKKEFEGALIKQLYNPFKETSQTGKEIAEFEIKEAKNLTLTKMQFINCIKVISESLRPVLEIQLFPNDRTGAKFFCRISFSLVQ